MTRDDAILLIVDLGNGGVFETPQNKEAAIQRLMKVELSDFYDLLRSCRSIYWTA